MKKLVLILPILFVLSCKNKEQKLREKILPILTDIIKKDSVVYKIDSIHIYKIDTLTDVKYANQTMTNLNAKFDFYTSMFKSDADLADNENESVRLSENQTRIYSMLNSSVLTDVSIDETKSKIKQASAYMKEAQLYLDSAKTVNAQIEKIKANIKSGKVNSKNFRGYIVLFKLVGADKKNMEVIKDSLNTYITPTFRIIPAFKM